jgi:uncharacterized membrane protein YhhN
MMSLIRNPKDFWSGVIYLAAALFGLIIGSDYSMGRAGQMGPGYFPIILSSLLLLFGIVTLIRAFVVPGESVTRFATKPVLLIVGSVVIFALLVERAGFIIAMFVSILLCASASREFRFEWRAALGLVLFIAACALLFVKGLGVPMPLIGSWFDPR